MSTQSKKLATIILFNLVELLEIKQYNLQSFTVNISKLWQNKTRNRDQPMFIHKITFAHLTERFFDNKDKSRDDFHKCIKCMITCASNLWINDWTHSPGFCVAILNSHYTVGGLDAIFLYVDIINACAHAYIYPNKGILYFQSDWIILNHAKLIVNT